MLVLYHGINNANPSFCARKKIRKAKPRAACAVEQLRRNPTMMPLHKNKKLQGPLKEKLRRIFVN
jgi:hypothetical protein